MRVLWLMITWGFNCCKGREVWKELLPRRAGIRPLFRLLKQRTVCMVWRLTLRSEFEEACIVRYGEPNWKEIWDWLVTSEPDFFVWHASRRWPRKRLRWVKRFWNVCLGYGHIVVSFVGLCFLLFTICTTNILRTWLIPPFWWVGKLGTNCWLLRCWPLCVWLILGLPLILGCIASMLPRGELGFVEFQWESMW